MKVKELMEILKNFDPDAEVYGTGGERDYQITEAEKDEFGDCSLS